MAAAVASEPKPTSYTALFILIRQKEPKEFELRMDQRKAKY
jgi:hypothetical protein